MTMTVAQLIARLQKITDQDAEVVWNGPNPPAVNHVTHQPKHKRVVLSYWDKPVME